MGQQGYDGPESPFDRLVRAIRGQERVRLVYARQRDEVVSIHEVAPIDIRPGDTPRTAATLYVWAWCFAESKPETHLLARIQRVLDTADTFDAAAMLKAWIDHWPLPDGWKVERSWPDR